MRLAPFTLLLLAACSRQDSPSPASIVTTPAQPAVQLQADSGFGQKLSAGGPVISLIVDDLGEQHDVGQRALKLPGQIAYAFLPGTPYVAREAETAYRSGREVLLHLPMEHPGGKLYSLGLSQNTPRDELIRRFNAGLASVPHASGVNNHQGSLLTERRETMIWLMHAIRARGGLYFVDSRTSQKSVAYEVARQMGLPAARREVFLDTVREPGAIRRAWQLTLAIARKHGAALAIGHPYPETLAMLEAELPRLKARGVRLVAPSELIRLRGNDQPRMPGPLKITPTLMLATRTTDRSSPMSTTAAAANTRASQP